MERDDPASLSDDTADGIRNSEIASLKNKSTMAIQ